MPAPLRGQQTGRKRRCNPRLGTLRVVLVAAALGMVLPSSAAGAPPSFGDEKTTWHGFDRYDFLMDEADLSIKPFKAAAGRRQRRQDPGEGPVAVRRRRPEEGGPRQPLVLARLLLRPRAAGRNRAAQARLPRRLHLVRRRQAVGRLVRVPHREARAVEEAGLHRHEPGRPQRLHLGHRQPRQGLVHLRRQPRRQSGGARRCSAAWPRTTCRCSTSAAASTRSWATTRWSSRASTSSWAAGSR